MAEAQPLLESESQEQLGTPAQWPEPMDGSGFGQGRLVRDLNEEEV